MARRGLYVISNGKSTIAHSNAAGGVSIVYDVIEWYFRNHCDRELLKVVPQLPRCHEHRICYLLIVRVWRFAWCKDLRYLVYWFLEWKFMSLFLSFDDEHRTHHLVSCRYVELKVLVID